MVGVVQRLADRWGQLVDEVDQAKGHGDHVRRCAEAFVGQDRSQGLVAGASGAEGGGVAVEELVDDDGPEGEHGGHGVAFVGVVEARDDPLGQVRVHLASPPEGR